MYKYFPLLFSIELNKTEMPDIAAEKERINAEVEKLNRERVDIAVKMQTQVKVWWNPTAVQYCIKANLDHTILTGPLGRTV
jgi:hypothetical protein